MKESVERIIEREGQNGLIIVKAIYGKIEEEDKNRYRFKIFDQLETRKVNFLIIVSLF